MFGGLTLICCIDPASLGKKSKLVVYAIEFYYSDVATTCLNIDRIGLQYYPRSSLFSMSNICEGEQSVLLDMESSNVGEENNYLISSHVKSIDRRILRVYIINLCLKCLIADARS